LKLIAYLLPQFHAIPENDRWWGKGFTEWTNMNKAVPLYPGHAQPKEPLNDDYYDLSRPEARSRQAELAKAYGIHGFCYYHYWFKGKRLLEKPFQEVLRLGEPDFPFCLCWANEPWTRRWDGGDRHVLMPQEYGQERDWAQHFYELLPAFRDSRYIRLDRKPLFLIYRPESIPNCAAMLRVWRRLARENGLEGLYLVQTLGGFPISRQPEFDASVEFEPHYTFAHGGLGSLWSRVGPRDSEHLVFDYDHIWHHILHRHHRRGREPIFPGAFVDWDNTPRLGTRGQSCIGASPAKFERYLRCQLERGVSLYESEFLFINAWNEWAEGAFLEPDKRHRCGYLEAVSRALAYIR